MNTSIQVSCVCDFECKLNEYCKQIRSYNSICTKYTKPYFNWV